MIAILTKHARGKVYNIGGGKENSISVVDAVEKLKVLMGVEDQEIRFLPKREGDQKVYISDIKKANDELDWKPKISIDQGFPDLVNWITTWNS